jgi:hypothetical protein
MPLGRHISLQLAPAPRRVGIPHFQHQFFHLRARLSRRMMWASWQIGQGGLTTGMEPLQPLIPSGGTNAESSAQISQVRSLPLGQSNKLSPLRHHRHLFPRHAHLHTNRSCQLSPWCPPCLRTCVSYVSGPYTPLLRGTEGDFQSSSLRSCPWVSRNLI